VAAPGAFFEVCGGLLARRSNRKPAKKRRTVLEKRRIYGIIVRLRQFFLEIQNMGTNDVKGGQAQDSGELSSSGPKDRGRQNVWKIVVFTVVAALAGTLAAHSLLSPASCGGCGGGGGRWTNTVGAGCPEEVAIKTAAYTADKACCPGAEASFESTNCVLAKEAAKTCPNSPGTPKHPCCPGGRNRRGQK
jgi:hypothetical protein